jgi:cobalt-zinc-cadmium efflux system outer membrane protein
LIDENPDIARWASEIDKDKASLELEKAKGISDITLKGGMSRFNETDDNAFMFGISIPLPLFDRNQGGRQAAAYELSKAREEERAATNRIRVELAKAYQRLFNSYIKASKLDKDIIQGAESVFESSKIAYAQGKLDYLNVLDSQRTLFEAKGQYIDALASYHIAKADVERLIGRSIEKI